MVFSDLLNDLPADRAQWLEMETRGPKETMAGSVIL